MLDFKKLSILNFVTIGFYLFPQNLSIAQKNISKDDNKLNASFIGSWVGSYKKEFSVGTINAINSKLEIMAGNSTFVMDFSFEEDVDRITTFYRCVFGSDDKKQIKLTLLPTSKLLKSESKVDCPAEIEVNIVPSGIGYLAKVKFKSYNYNVELSTNSEWQLTGETYKPLNINFQGLSFSSSYDKIKTKLRNDEFIVEEFEQKDEKTGIPLSILWAYQPISELEIRRNCEATSSSGLSPERRVTFIFHKSNDVNSNFPIAMISKTEPLLDKPILYVEARNQLIDKFGPSSSKDSLVWYFDKKGNLYNYGRTPDGENKNMYRWYSRDKNGNLNIIPYNSGSCQTTTSRGIKATITTKSYYCRKDRLGQMSSDNTYWNMPLSLLKECAFTVNSEIDRNSNMKYLNISIVDREAYMKIINEDGLPKIDLINNSDILRARSNNKNKLKL